MIVENQENQIDSDMYLSLDNIKVENENEEQKEIVKKEEEILDENGKVITANPEEEEEEEEEKKPEYANKQFEKDNKEKSPSSESDDLSSTISVFANYLKEEGVISSELEGLEDVKSLEDLKKIVAEQIKVEKYADLNDGQRRYLEAMESGIPEKEFEVFEKEISFLENVTIEELTNNDQLRFDLIVKDLIDSGMTEEKAVKVANRSFEAEDDLEEAKEAIKNLHERASGKFQEVTKSLKEETKIGLEEVQKAVFSKEKILDDVKLSKIEKENLYKVMTTKVDVAENGNPLNQFAKWRIENGIEAEIILNALFIKTNGFKNLGTIKTQATTSATKALEAKLRSTEIADMTNKLNQEAKKTLKTGMTLM